MAETESQLPLDGEEAVEPGRKALFVSVSYTHLYDLMEELDPYSMNDLLRVHRVMMDGLAKDAGRLRTKNAGVYDGERLILSLIHI